MPSEFKVLKSLVCSDPSAIERLRSDFDVDVYTVVAMQHGKPDSDMSMRLARAYELAMRLDFRGEEIAVACDDMIVIIKDKKRDSDAER